MSELQDVELPFWVIIVVVLIMLCCMIAGCVCFTLRCFSPENHLGPLVEVNSVGKQWIRRPNTVAPSWLASESAQDPRAPMQGGKTLRGGG